MNDQLHTYIEPELEARITALVLDEAWDSEAEELEELIDARPELAIFRRRIQAIHAMIGSAVKPEQDPQWQLSTDKRAALKETFRRTNQPPVSRQKTSTSSISQRNIAFTAAACLAICIVVFATMAPLSKKGEMLRAEPSVITYSPDLEQSAPADEFKTLNKKQSRSAARKPSVPGSSMSRITGQDGKPKVPAIGNLPTTGRLFKEKKGRTIDIVGNDKTTDRVIRREIPVSPGKKMPAAKPTDSSIVAVPDVDMDGFNSGADFGDGDDFDGGQSDPFASEGEGKDRTIAKRETNSRSTGGRTSGITEKSDIEIVREFVHPTEYEPPELPNAVTGSRGKSNGASIFPVTPTSPTNSLTGELDRQTVELLKKNNRPSPDSLAFRVDTHSNEFTEAAKRGTATAGLRSGDFATTRTSIDGVLNNPNRSKGRNAYARLVEDEGRKTDSKFLSGGMAGASFDESKKVGPYDIAANDDVSESNPVRRSNGIAFGVDDDGIVTREHARRGGSVGSADKSLTNGRDAYSRKDYNKAAKHYSDALAKLPPGSALEDRRKSYRQHLADANVALAQKARRTGKYEEARKLLTEAASLDSENPQATEHLEYLDDPIRTSPALTYKHAQAVKEVRKGLYRTEGLYNLGRFEDAEAEATKVLDKDKYNKAARRMLEKIAVAKSDYYSAAHDHTRAELLREVDAAWELTVPPVVPEVAQKAKPSIKPTPQKAPSQTTSSKLARIRQELQNKTNQVADARKKLMDIAEKSGVIWVEDEQGGRSIGSMVELSDLAQKQLFNSEREAEQLRFQIGKLLKLEPADMIAMAAELPDVGFKETHEKYIDAKRELSALKATGLSDKHPAVLARKQNIEELNKSLERRAKNVKKSLKHKLAIVDGRVAKMREVVLNERTKGTSKARLIKEFNQARKAYQTQLNIKDNMQVQYDLEKVRQLAKDGKPVPTEPASTPAIPAPARPKALPDETSTTKQPFSTFSLNVADVSFKLAKAALLEKGQWPDAAKVRTEEFVNAFDYGDAAPRRGEPVACAIEQAAHPFLQQRNLLRIGMKTAAAGRSQPLRLTILLDNSGSMERDDREASVLAAMKVLASQLGQQDVVTLVSFARTPRLLADRISGDKANTLVNIVAKTPSEGGTNLEEALRLSHKLAKRQQSPGTQSRVVLITDGVANLGNTVPEELSRQIETMRQQGIAFDACGIGAEDLNDEILEALTRKGDGRYYFLNRPEDADSGFAKQLAGALSPAAKNVKVQVVFNPKRVSRYRLLGFEKHRLNKEDFRNDKVDAAEMASEEAGNAVYQIEVNPAGSGELGEVFVRFLDASTGKMVERSWPLPYEPQAKPLENAAPSMQLAGTAAMLGEKLHGTDAGSVRIPMLSTTLNKLRTHYQHDPKVQDLIRMCEKVR